MPVPISAAGPRPFNRRQTRQNAAFLAALRQTGNARLAARQLGLNRSTFTKRRAKHPAFAARWDAALAAADAAFCRSGGTRPPQPASRSSRAASSNVETRPSRDRTRTNGGEPTVVRTLGGRLQLRLAPPGRMTAEAQDDFLEALADTANLRYAADAIGFAHTTLLARKRRHPAFAIEIAEARAAAPEAIERTDLARAEAVDRNLPTPSGWPSGMSVRQALHQLGAAPLKLPCTPFPTPSRP